MGGFCGLLSNHGTVDVLSLRTVGESLRRLGPGDVCEEICPPIGMLQRSVGTTQADHGARPFRDGHDLVVFDGRLDNHRELASRLFGAERRAVDVADAELILQAYRLWGLTFVERLLGDFALALWDGAQRRLLLARDVFGVKPLYFVQHRNRIAWSSAPESLLRFVDTASPDKRFLASYLWFVPDETHSPFEGIEPVAPAHYVLFEGEHVRRTEYWKITDLIGIVRYRKDADYEDHFLSVFQDAVRSRLRTDGRVTAEVSGGLDSSSVACVADHLLGDEAEQRLRTLSFVYPRQQGSDESRYIEAVERAVRGRHFRIAETPKTLISRAALPGFLACPTTLSCFPGKAETPFGLLAAESSRVVLSGEGGDAAFRNDESYPVAVHDRWSFTKPQNLIARVMEWSSTEGTGVWDVLWNSFAKPKLRFVTIPQKGRPPWISDNLLRESNLDEYLHQVATGLRGRCDATSLPHCAFLLMGRAKLAGGEQGYTSATEHAEVRYPYLDTRLLRFLLSIPQDQLSRPGERRSVMRRGLIGILPEAVRTRRFKTFGNEALMAAVEANSSWISSLIEDSIAVASGYARKEPLLQLLKRVRFGMHAELLQFLHFIAVELWLRNISCVDIATTKSKTWTA